jgi:hypothetical protein
MERWREQHIPYVRSDDEDPPDPPQIARAFRVRPRREQVDFRDRRRPRADQPERLDLPGELAKLELRGGLSDLGPARLRVAAVGGGGVEVGGWLTPARIVHASVVRDVVVGNDCALKQTEHHHFDRVTVSLKQVLQDRRVREALRTLVREGFTWFSDGPFRAALRRTLIDQGKSAEELDRPLADPHAGRTTRSGVVQVGDGSRPETEIPIMVRETVLPGAELLYRNVGLRRTFVEALHEPEETGPQLGRFLRDTLAAARCTDQLRLLDFAAESGVCNAAVFGLFGFARVTNAGAVLAGPGNTFVKGVEVDVREFTGDDIAHAVAVLRSDVAPPKPFSALLAATRPPAPNPPYRWWDARLADQPKPPPPPPHPRRPGG